ncbi:DMT family transporter [Alicyclobacillus dauci]|uniref:EamA family transporter n=1 Tax=Alicyclobacillus dauci TaxID=1475485 RepID=A0ABY6Z2C7_9BACL|nr:EamA family transporter [Alicyclobacillus dauci]WAH36140.1 EamA family transporter [Alicyclobacillus dauci]
MREKLYCKEKRYPLWRGFRKSVRGIVALEPNIAHSPSVTNHYRGVFMVLLGAVLWGVSGSAAQVLFQRMHFAPGWLVHIRMTASGIMLLGYVGVRYGPGRVFEIWRSAKDAGRLVLLALVGLLGVQYTYFAAIADSNAATATLLQYLAPVLVVLWALIENRSRPKTRQTLAVIAAVFGTSLLVTNGKLAALGISVGGLVWGLSSALALAFYSIYPRRLLTIYGSLPIVGWCMLLGGITMGFFHPTWKVSATITPASLYLIAFVVICGTMIAFSLFTASLKVITSEEASLLSCAEPLASAVFAVLFLHLRLSPLGWIGALLILVAVVILSRSR